MTFRFRSLQARLAARLTVVVLAATCLIVGVIIYQGTQAADDLGNEQLMARAAELARYVARDGSAGMPRLTLPPGLSGLYAPSSITEMFLITARDGRVIAAFPSNFAGSGEAASTAGTEPKYFRLEQFGPNGEDYYGLRLRLDSAAGEVIVTVARASDADAIAIALLRAFIRQIAWTIPVFAGATLAVAVWSIRRGLQPIESISAQARRISPTATGTRLSETAPPSEIVPLVRAVNQALDRLEEGFAVQRRFTANAAHELRTPLAILTAGLESISDGPDVGKLRPDAARMNRMVDQLLRVARLDALPATVSETIALGAMVAEVVAYLAPWALARDRELVFEGPPDQVLVRGNAGALSDAVRNLIENAVTHTPPDTEVTISVSSDGTITVADHGPGVAVDDRPFVFDRFWRGRTEQAAGAGLGLAIVAEVANMHAGSIEIRDAPGGGALFILHLPVAMVTACMPHETQASRRVTRFRARSRERHDAD